MSFSEILLIGAGILVIAALYSSVGHAGASGYLAILALCGLAATTIRPIALSLNVLVAIVASWQFYRAGYFSWKLFWPFAATSIPCAFWAGSMALSAQLLKLLLGVVLLLSALRMLWNPPSRKSVATPQKWIAATWGAGLGLLAGWTGTGGGIFLSPLLLIAGWAEPRQTAATSSFFILTNSVAGLLGFLWSGGQIPASVIPWSISALAGGFLGSYAGSMHFSNKLIRRLLSVVLTIAGAKMLVQAGF